MLSNNSALPLGGPVPSPFSYGQEFHLLSETPVNHLRLFRPSDKTPANHSTVVLPPGVAFVSAPSAELPRRLEVPPETFKDILIFETFLDLQGRPRLAVVNPGETDLRVNDHLSPRLVVLHEGDLVSLEGTNPMHVAVFNRPYVGAPPVEVIGLECRVCRVPFRPETKCYACACGASLHCEDGQSFDGALQCALSVPDCPSCNRSIVLTEGYLSVPDFLHA